MSAPTQQIPERQVTSLQSTDLFAELMNTINHENQAWLANSKRTAFFNRLRASRPSAGWRIQKAICLALGPLEGLDSLDTGEKNERQRTEIAQQLVLFLDIVNFLQSEQQPTNSTKIEIYAQDPRFQPIDIALLTSLGIHILAVPAAERLTRRGVFTFVPEFMLEYQLLARPRSELRPSLHVGLGLEDVAGMCEHHGIREIEAREGSDLPGDAEIVEQAEAQIESLDEIEVGYERFGVKEAGCDMIIAEEVSLTVWVEREGERGKVEGEVRDGDVMNLSEREVCDCCMMPE